MKVLYQRCRITPLWGYCDGKPKDGNKETVGGERYSFEVSTCLLDKDTCGHYKKFSQSGFDLHLLAKSEYKVVKGRIVKK